ncbi:NAD(P)-dependent dehydrogenase (short-subunit alcohol dehydrogenase family) [Microbacterium trichothecenolyticum]|uniref:SDR family NAD(P)-dependent oxidoreductase n=1 Tax=Microbacterium trichothecenolyticum TaxID=69370 RepID=UPI00285783AE|nr:SDR family oxidoreductase [Microbacterium trichothecenolyticum]MDR7112249.1 NAD(P)-dependent dehydrogenase (short-subunit alcohol dehydrogenase family) [Microbacterium trichothecenolyticum]
MLAAKRVIITGAGRGLGRAYAIAAAAAGASVVVGDIDTDAAEQTVAAIRASGGNGVAVTGSVADWAVARALTERCVQEFGGVDGVVANAAIMSTADPWDEAEDDLRAIAEVNILGVQFTARHAMRAMVESGRGGSVVTVVSGARDGIAGMSAYGASKGAVAAMTANWALAGHAHGIRVNAISPLGLTRMSQADHRSDRPPMPDPSRVAPVVTALLSDASAPLTGAVLRFDGTMLGRYDSSLHTFATSPAGWRGEDLAAALVLEAER